MFETHAELAVDLAVELAFDIFPHSPAHPAGLCVGDFGDVGVAFFWFRFLARQEKGLAAGQPRPAASGRMLTL